MWLFPYTLSLQQVVGNQGNMLKELAIECTKMGNDFFPCTYV